VTVRLKRFVKLWVDLFAKHELLDHASAIAFAVLKALVPLTLLGLALLGAVGEQRVWEQTIFPIIQAHVQAATAHAIDVAAGKIFSTNSAGLIVFASLLTLWYVSGSVRGVMSSTNTIYGCEETRSWKQRYPTSLGLAAAITLCLVGAILVVLVAPTLARHGALQVVVGIGRWVVAIGLLAPPLLAATAVGAAVGGLAGKFARHRAKAGIGDKLDEALPPGSAGIIASAGFDPMQWFTSVTGSSVTPKKRCMKRAAASLNAAMPLSA